MPGGQEVAHTGQQAPYYRTQLTGEEKSPAWQIKHKKAPNEMAFSVTLKPEPRWRNNGEAATDLVGPGEASGVGHVSISLTLSEACCWVRITRFMWFFFHDQIFEMNPCVLSLKPDNSSHLSEEEMDKQLMRGKPGLQNRHSQPGIAAWKHSEAEQDLHKLVAKKEDIWEVFWNDIDFSLLRMSGME